MNASLTTLFTAIGAVAASAVLALALAEPGAALAPPQEVVKLERVVVVGKRLNAADLQVAQQRPQQRIEKLPRVVIEGRRADTLLADRSCAAQTLC
ncbi:hypothetical protein BH11PSE10_BH11PSE10_07310 [soil metagenome]